MKKGETLTLKAVVAPEKATNKGIKWSSSNTKVAAVDKNGKVKSTAKRNCHDQSDSKRRQWCECFL